MDQPADDIAGVLSHFNVNTSDISRAIEDRFGPSNGALVVGEIPLSPGATSAMEGAMREARENHLHLVDQSHLFLALLDSSTEPVADMLQGFGIDPGEARRMLSQRKEDRDT